MPDDNPPRAHPMVQGVAPDPLDPVRRLRSSLNDPRERDRLSHEEYARALRRVAAALRDLDSVADNVAVWRSMYTQIADSIQRDEVRSRIVDRLRERSDEATRRFKAVATSYIVTPELARLYPPAQKDIGRTYFAPMPGDEEGERLHGESCEALKKFCRAADLVHKARELEKLAVVRIGICHSRFCPEPEASEELVARLTDDRPCDSWDEVAQIVGHKSKGHALEVAVARSKPGDPYYPLKNPTNRVKKGRGRLPTRGTAELVRFNLGKGLVAARSAMRRRRKLEERRKASASPADGVALRRAAYRRLMEIGMRGKLVED